MYKIDFDNPPAGHALSFANDGESVQVMCREFTSTEDGQDFIQKLEGFPNTILHQLPCQIKPSQVDHMLAIFFRDGKANVYVNELKLKTKARMTRSVKLGEKLTKDDFVELGPLELGVTIPADAGFLFVFSIGWRKGLFYDFKPCVGPTPQPRVFDVATELGKWYCHVLFQEMFSVTDIEWDRLYKSQWFLFTGLSKNTIKTMITYIKFSKDPDEKLNDIVSEVKVHAPQMLHSWRSHFTLQPHIEILECAIERFQNDDPVNCTGLLFPRIEGILRTHHDNLDIQKKPTSKYLTELAVSSKIENVKSLLLPHRFNKYLQEVYFANFKPDSKDIAVTRHSVGHGVASASNFNQKSAVIGILIVHQLFYFLINEQRQQTLDVEATDTVSLLS